MNFELTNLNKKWMRFSYILDIQQWISMKIKLKKIVKLK